MAEITFQVASVADISSLVAKITFVVAEINIMENLITSQIISNLSVILTAITQNIFFGNDGTNLHKNGSWEFVQLVNIANRYLRFF